MYKLSFQINHIRAFILRIQINIYLFSNAVEAPTYPIEVG